MSEPQPQVGALVRQPVRVIASRRGEQLMDQVFQHTPIRIGRLLDNDVVLPFDFVSRYHCEIRFENGQWTAIDLGSKNGLLLSNQTRAQEIPLTDGSGFRIQEVSIDLVLEAPAVRGDTFNAIRENDSIIIDESSSDPKEFTSTPQPRNPSSPPKQIVSTSEATFIEPVAPSKTSSQKNYRDVASIGATPSRASKASVGAAPPAVYSRSNHSSPPARSHDSAGERRPLLDLQLETVLYGIHPSVELAKERALQVIVIWHDQLLEAKEVEVGSDLTIDLFGWTFDLGKVRSDKMQLKLPKGCTCAGQSADPKGKQQVLTVSWLEPAEFKVGGILNVRLRYVPKSNDLARKTNYFEEKLVNPLLVSSAVHGVTALSVLMMAPKHESAKPIEEPDRFATIIISPTPEPEVALQPTPTPTATPPELKPEPPEIVEIEKPKPKPLVKKVVVEKKLRKVAEKRKEAPSPKAPPVEKKPDSPKIVAKAESIPMPLQASQPPPPPPEKPAPTPQPFNAKSVGALKMLSMLSTGPASNVANIEKIQISRVPATDVGQMMARETVAGTGDMISKLAQSSRGSSANNIGTVAVGGKNAAGKYEVAGLGGKAGKQKVLGTVIGGATYTENSKNEGLTRDQVMKVVQKNQARIQQCYERALLDNPDLVGSADFEWEILASGAVSVVNVKNATIKNAESLLGCVKNVFTQMKFPQAKNGEGTTSTIGLPFGRL